MVGPFFVFDVETHLITPHEPVPKLVCMSTSEGVFTGDDIRYQLEGALEAEATFVGHRVAYDIEVLRRNGYLNDRAVVELYENSRVLDTNIIQLLLVLRREIPTANSYTLASLAKIHLNMDLDKGEDTWRLRYKELDGVPLEEWPKEAIEYSLKDAQVTRDVFRAQHVLVQSGDFWKEAARQTRADYALSHCAWGNLRADAGSVEALTFRLRSTVSEHQGDLVEAGVYNRLKSGALKLTKKGEPTRSFKRIRELVEADCAARGERPVRTPKGQISLSEEVFQDVRDPVLKKLALVNKSIKTLSTFVPILEQAVKEPLRPRYNCIMATGRTSCKNPNVQQFPREGGVRECFVPSPGYVFINCDYVEAELIAMAQILKWMFGQSSLLDAYKEGKQPHLLVAAKLLHDSYENTLARYKVGDEVAKKARQFAKVVNYGCWGGLSAESLRRHAKKNKVEMTAGEAVEVRDAFLRTWIEAPLYFDWAAQKCRSGTATHVSFVSHRERAGVRYTELLNSNFQALIADVAKDALWHTVVACKFDDKSALYGSNLVAFLHDEIMVETPEAKASEAGKELSRIMNYTAKRWMPDVDMQSTPALSRRWMKDAKTIYDAEGNLQVFEPK